MSDFQIETLPNGIRLVHKQVVHTRVAHCGFVLDTGSRDEAPGEWGIAHFWEHMAFKGTHKRKAYHILNSLESVGGELNAFTTKEKICFHASVLGEHLPKAIELLSDILFDSVFPEKEIEKERQVILEEMAMYEDSPDEAIADEFEALLYAGHTLGNNILGTQETVSAFRREDLLGYVDKHLDTSRLVFATVGNFSLAQIRKLAMRFFGERPAQSRAQFRQPFLPVSPQRVEQGKAIQQAHVIWGRTAPPLQDERRIPFFMLVNILGGPGMNSRLNLSLRERHGLVYSADASYTPFTDTGELALYFATEPKNRLRAQDLVAKELKTLREKPLGRTQLFAAKQQLKGQLAIGEENNASLMIALGKSLLDLERIDTLPELFARIDRVSATELQDLAQEWLDPNQLTALVYRPE